MKKTRRQLRHLILKEFKDYFTGFDVDTILNPEEQVLNQKKVWGVRFTQFEVKTHDFYMIFYSEAAMDEFVKVFKESPGLENYLSYLQIKHNTDKPPRDFFTCKGVNDPKIIKNLCDSNTDSILIYDHSQIPDEQIPASVLTSTHSLYYNPTSTPIIIKCR